MDDLPASSENDAPPPGCPRNCQVPTGFMLTAVPTPRHAWSDVIVCPYEDCALAFLVTRPEVVASGSSAAAVPPTD